MNLVRTEKNFKQASRCVLKLFLAVVLLQAGVDTTEATQYQGEFTGIWTVGVPSANINPGDSFTWQYTYISDLMDGTFGMASPSSGDYVLRGEIPGLEGGMDDWAAGYLTIEGGNVVAAMLRYEFDDPRNPPAVSIFSIGLESFCGFGEGTISFLCPVEVPEPKCSLLVILFSSVSLVWRRQARSNRAGCCREAQ